MDPQITVATEIDEIDFQNVEDSKQENEYGRDKS